MTRLGLAAALLALAPAVRADTSPRGSGTFETRWTAADWVAAANNPLAVDERDGETVAIRIRGIGESAMIRRRIWKLAAPRTISWKLRWTAHGPAYDHAFPSVHVLFDPPALDHAWWSRPIGHQEGGTGGRWTGSVTGYTLHLSTCDVFRQCGVGPFLEVAPDRHDFSPAAGEWIRVQVAVHRDRVVASVNGRRIAESKVDLRAVATFSVAFGDQCDTRVELDELTVR